ncbi:MAG: hypothetical protein K0B87_00330 [Candidatus Syntrophosphaera sp.]|nr:hypothetical protein [Candidatus Syntrophosphaera sp.]
MIHVLDTAEIVRVALKLLESSDDRIRLGVSPEMIAGIKARDLALEILLPKSVEIKTSFGHQLKVINILIPLSGEYGPGPEMASALIFSGFDGYADGPDQNNFAREDLLELQELLKF